MQDPSPAAYSYALGVLAYLHSTKDLGLTYDMRRKPCAEPSAETSTPALVLFTDSSFGTSPYPFGGGFVEKNNAAVSWFARKPKFVADSTCMAELSVIVAGIKEGQFCALIEEDMGNTVPILHVISDSKSAIDIIKNPGVTKRSAHYDRWLHYGRDQFLKGRVKLFLTKTDNMMADNLTKVTDRDKFFKCRNYQMNI